MNRSIVLWALARLPFKLMFTIPTAMEVLQMQAAGERVITLFTQEQDLASQHTAKLHYMSGEQQHSRDALAFLIHDMKHMSHFSDPQLYKEQVGFFKRMMTLPKNIKKLGQQSAFGQSSDLEELFVNYLQFDLQLWHEVEYLISDMNCFSTHLVQYLVAKICAAVSRCPCAVPSPTLEARKETRLSAVLTGLGLSCAQTQEALAVLLGLQGGGCAVPSPTLEARKETQEALATLVGPSIAADAHNDFEGGNILSGASASASDPVGVTYRGGVFSRAHGEAIRQFFRSAAAD